MSFVFAYALSEIIKVVIAIIDLRVAIENP